MSELARRPTLSAAAAAALEGAVSRDAPRPGTNVAALDAAEWLMGLGGMLMSTWAVLSGEDRERMLGEVVVGAARLRRLLGADVTEGPGRQDLRDELESPTSQLFLQPVVWLPTREVVGFEALTRFHRWSPDLWFARAWMEGSGLPLELRAVSRALGALDGLPADVFLAINVSPPTVVSATLARLLSEADASRIVLELTETDHNTDYAIYQPHLERLRALGVRIAIDDAGAGHSSLHRIVQLAPEIIKVDRSLVSHCNDDPVRRALMTCLATFANETRTRLVAEGVETEEEADALVSYGVAFGQGYLFGRPGPDPQLAVSTATGGWVVDGESV